MAYDKIIVPREGSRISINEDLSLYVPNDPIIPFIEGDGIGVDITPVMKKVVDSAVKKAYGTERKIYWMEVYCGEKASKIYDGNELPEETLQALKEFIVSIKGPLSIMVAGIAGIDTKTVEIKGVGKEGVEIITETITAVDITTDTTTDTENIEETATTVEIEDVAEVKNIEDLEQLDDDERGKPSIHRATSYAVYSSIANAKIANTSNNGVDSSDGAVNDTDANNSHETFGSKYAGQDKANPTALILSAEMMLRDLGWTEASKLIAKGVEGAIANKTVTYDFETMFKNVASKNMAESGSKATAKKSAEEFTVVSCSAFGDAVIAEM